MVEGQLEILKVFRRIVTVSQKYSVFLQKSFEDTWLVLSVKVGRVIRNQHIFSICLTIYMYIRQFKQTDCPYMIYEIWRQVFQASKYRPIVN